jgi:tellurite resistance protein
LTLLEGSALLGGMSITHTEAVASLHVLVAVAQADGNLHVEERNALETGLREVGLDADFTASDLFDDAFDLDEQLGMLESEEAREEAFTSAYSLAWADGDCSPKRSDCFPSCG